MGLHHVSRVVSSRIDRRVSRFVTPVPAPDILATVSGRALTPLLRQIKRMPLESPLARRVQSGPARMRAVPVRAPLLQPRRKETDMLYANPRTPGAKVDYKAAYDNFIGGRFVPPLKGQYFDVITPITGQPYTRAARSGPEDIELALDAAHAAADGWGRTPAADRANILLKIADRLEQNLERLAYAESVDNGKPIRETLAGVVEGRAGP
jgi:hypothetical protein